MYNGWTNHSTWEQFNYMSNTESAYTLWSENAEACVNEYQSTDIAVSVLAQQMSDYYGEDPDINWEEIAQAFLE